MDSHHRFEQASDNSTLDADVQSCRSECNWLTGDKPPSGWHIHANRLLRT